MADNRELQQIVERAVGQVFADQMPRLQAELTERVMEALPAPAEKNRTAADAGNLRQIVADIQAGATQKEILRALLDGGSTHSARIALFVVKAGAVTGWQARGFADDEVVKDFSLDLNAGPVAHAYQNRVATPANIAEMDGRFVQLFGRPADEQLLLVPLVLKDKVAALLYADGGESGVLDAPSLELLVMATSAWLEVISLRKQTQRDAGDGSFERVGEHVPPAQTVNSFSDPFAAHSPKHIAPAEHVAASPDPEPAAEVVEVAISAHAQSAGAASAPAAATDPYAGFSPEDADTHRKAQRFARLLVDEIKLYNQAKVAEGRRNKDLYDRLKDDIEKSRSTYQKRYGSTAAASGEYFQQEIVRSLAEDDASVMGGNFRR